MSNPDGSVTPEMVDEIEGGVAKIEYWSKVLPTKIELYKIFLRFCFEKKIPHKSVLNEWGTMSMPEPQRGMDDVLGAMILIGQKFEAQSKEMYKKIEDAGELLELHNQADFKAFMEKHWEGESMLELPEKPGYNWILRREIVEKMADDLKAQLLNVGENKRNN